MLTSIFRIAAVAATATLCQTMPVHAAGTLTPGSVIKEMKRVADWQIANPSKHPVHDWTQAPFYMGLMALYQVSGDAAYRDAADGFGKRLNYGPGPRVTHADDHAVFQAWLMLHRLDHDQAKMRPAMDHFEKVRAALSKEPVRALAGGTLTWDWCDALFMSPAVWAELSVQTKDPKYLEWADREWWTTTDVLYDPSAHLFYRDARFFGKLTPGGHKTFWARGNGWVCGGLANMLDRLPADHPSRPRYLALYHDMMYALVKLQGSDGLWRTSLLEPGGPVGESSGSAFFAYAMAWGLNRGLLPEKPFRPAVFKAWNALTGHIQPDGMLGFVQRVADRPDGSTVDAKATEVYGTGAFLLAGAEIVRMLEPAKREKDLASFDGVKLPEAYQREEPRCRLRFVPERKDDFAWENDKVAYRTYGPALRGGVEDSGIDCWFKRVPYPIMDKFYVEDRTVLKFGKKPKAYHDDHGEGYDGYKVGNTRGCGGISAYDDGKLYNSGPFVAWRIIEDTPQRLAFELDYASTFKGQVLRETKRVTLPMGEHLCQYDSRFTLDGKPAANLQVAIGLTQQTTHGKITFTPKVGIMTLWEKMDGLWFGEGVVINPASVVNMITHIDAAKQKQALCIAKTDKAGHIRWFAGYGWQGRSPFVNPDVFRKHITAFAAKHLKTPYAEPEFEVNTAPVPETPKPAPAPAPEPAPAPAPKP